MFCQICGIDVPLTTTKCPKCGGSIFVDENSPAREENAKQKDSEILTPLVSQTVGRWGLLCLLFSFFVVAFEGGLACSYFSLFVGAFLVYRQRRVNKENNVKIHRVKYMIVCYAMLALIVARNNMRAYIWLTDDQQSTDARLQHDNLADLNQEHVLSQQSKNPPNGDEVALSLTSFLGYTFGKKYGSGQGFIKICLEKPFRYIKKGYGTCDGKGRLIELRLSGDFPDGMSIEDAREELNIMRSMFERKYGISMKQGFLKDRWRYRSENGEVEIKVFIEDNACGRSFILEVENRRVLSLGKEVEALGADVGADML